MAAVRISPKYQVVIPKEIREKLGLIPVRPMKKLKGFLKGIDTRVEREADRTCTMKTAP